MEGRFHKLNPFTWSDRVVHVIFAAIFMIILPIYLISGLQTTAASGALEYPSLNIPGISLTTPVLPLELTDHQLIAPAKVAGAYSRHQNKTLIIGHSSTVFTGLSAVQVNDTFTYAGVTYQVTKLETLPKLDIDMLDILAETEKKTIIIMTCAGTPLANQDATHRLLVTAEALI